MNRWYAVATKVNHEDQATNSLLCQGYEVFAPYIYLRSMVEGEIRTRRKLLFPGYLFVNFDVDIQAASTINYSFGVSKLVSFGNVLATINDSVMEDLIAKYKMTKTIDTCYKPGQSVKIRSDIFQFVDTVFLEADGAKRSMIAMSILGNRLEVSMDNREIA